jgi:hypothetical protein
MKKYLSSAWILTFALFGSAQALAMGQSSTNYHRPITTICGVVQIVHYCNEDQTGDYDTDVPCYKVNDDYLASDTYTAAFGDLSRKRYLRHRLSGQRRR